MAKNYLTYKDYIAKVTYDAEARLLRGRVDGIVDRIVFECRQADEVEGAFHEAVDRYLAFCESAGRRPAKAYKGQFNVRIDPELHRALVELAAEREEKLNTVVGKALQAYVEKEGSHLLHTDE